MFFVHSPIIGTIDHHHLFESPFIAGIGLHPATSSQISAWKVRVSATESLTPAEATAALTRMVRDAIAELTTFRDDHARRVGNLRPLVADAAKLADAPLDMASDRATVSAYVEQARTLAAQMPPASRAIQNADQLARWIDRTEFLDRAPIQGALDAMEKAVAGIDKSRSQAEKIAADLQAALVRMDDPATAQRLAGLKLQRDLCRVLPDMAAEFAEAQAAALAAVARMSTIADKLKGLAA